MAYPKKFPGSVEIGRPPGIPEEECGGLPVLIVNNAEANMHGAVCVISQWQLTPEELQEVNRTGLINVKIFNNKVYAMSVSGITYPEQDYMKQISN